MAKYKKAMYALPSFFTLASVFCAFVSISRCVSSQVLVSEPGAYSAQMMSASLMILLSVVFDTFDGKVARLTKTSSAFGMELDSLADAISFGVAPGVLIYTFSLQYLGLWGLVAAFLYCCGAILRLARFNIEAPSEGVQRYFKGLPSPAGAAVILSTVMLFLEYNLNGLARNSAIGLSILSVVAGLLMVSAVRYSTFKGKDKSFWDYAFVIGGVLLFALVAIFENAIAALFLLVVYFVLSGILRTIGTGFKHALSKEVRPQSED